MSNLLVYTAPKIVTNPGKIIARVNIYDDQRGFVKVYSRDAGVGTNMLAEIFSIEYGLRQSYQRRPSSITIYSCNKVIIEQINGKMGVKDSKLSTVHQMIKIMMGNHAEVPISFNWIPKKAMPKLLA